MRPLHSLILLAAIVSAPCANAIDQDSTSRPAECPAVDSAVKGSLQPHSYLLGWYDPSADTTHLEGGGTEPRIPSTFASTPRAPNPPCPGPESSMCPGRPLPDGGARPPPTPPRLCCRRHPSASTPTLAGRRYRRMDPYPIAAGGAESGVRHPAQYRPNSSAVPTPFQSPGCHRRTAAVAGRVGVCAGGNTEKSIESVPRAAFRALAACTARTRTSPGPRLSTLDPRPCLSSLVSCL
jgi:hypothetical protein